MASLKVDIGTAMERCKYQMKEYKNWRAKRDNTGYFIGVKDYERDGELNLISKIFDTCLTGDSLGLTEIYLDSGDVYLLFEFNYKY